MNNNFDDSLPKALKVPSRADKSVIDASAVTNELARAVGWYRKDSAEKESPKGMRAEAEEIAALLSELHKRIEIPVGGMNPLLRSLVLENMRHLRIPMPEFGRLVACVENAGRQLPAVKTGPSGNAARSNAARAVYLSVRANTTPQLGKLASRELTAQLLTKCGIAIPEGDKERREIMGEG